MPDMAIRVDHLVKEFGGGFWMRPRTRAVDGLSFTIERGAIFGLLGPNGAGKTTTLRILTTLVRPTSGHASVLGYDVAHQPGEVRRRIVVVIQEHAAELLLSVRDNLLTFARFHGLRGAEIRHRAERFMDDFGLRPEANLKVQDLSGGYRRRVQVAKVFMVETPSRVPRRVLDGHGPNPEAFGHGACSARRRTAAAPLCSPRRFSAKPRTCATTS